MIPDCFEFCAAIAALVDGRPTTLETYTHIPTGMEFVLIPGGSDLIGCQDPEAIQERPRHQVYVSPLLLSRYPVTLAVWRRVMGSEALHRPWSPTRSQTAALDDDHPVADISALECDEFCRRAGLQLPSEAEWEYACRAGDDEDHLNNLEDYAWFVDNCEQIRPVGLKKPNAFGLHDTLGNVWEWCADTWHDTYAGAPTDGAVWIDSTSAYRVARGGSVEHCAEHCTPFSRMCWPRDMTGSCAGLRVKHPLAPRANEAAAVKSSRTAVPDGFRAIGKRKRTFNGVDYELDWISHKATGLELPLLPGGLYNADSFPESWADASKLLSENVIIIGDDTSHPELLTSLLHRGAELYPILVAHFLTGDRETRGSAAFWHAQFTNDIERTSDYLPDAMPSGEVFAGALREDDEWIRAMAATTFGRCFEHSKPYLPALAQLLHSDETCSVVLEVFRELGPFAYEVFPEIVKAALSQQDAESRAAAVETMTSLSERFGFSDNISRAVRNAVIPPLLLLITTEGLAAVTAVHILVLLGHNSQDLLPVLHAALEGDDPEASRKASDCLHLIESR